MKVRTLTVLDIRDDLVCSCCFADRLKCYFDERAISTMAAFELLIVTPEQAALMQTLAWPGHAGMQHVTPTIWWGVPVSVQKR